MPPLVRSRRAPAPSAHPLPAASEAAPIHPLPAAPAAPETAAPRTTAPETTAPETAEPETAPGGTRRAVRARLRGVLSSATNPSGDAGVYGVELLGRGGLITYGVLHLLLAGLAVVLMRGSSTVHADQQGAIAVIAGIGPVGAALLGLSILGLVAFGVWQTRAALVGFRWVEGGERFRKRCGAAGKAIAMFSMASLAFPPAIGPFRGPPPGGPPAPSAPHGVSDLVTSIFALPAGRVAVGVAAAIALGMAVGMCWTGLNATYLGDLHAARLTPRLRVVARIAGTYGNLARAALTGSVGILFAEAAITGDARHSGGFTQAMWFIEGAGPFGTVALVGVSGGLAAYGVYCFVDAYARRA
ncbi:DUF1206 domain-containing protein [Actinomycetospora sp. NBRC 106378]|uniref:DUF1206 domain-containing protein n=1 Tax=Actinomycetospora sp. NBRC 106378 TaxID=3032208 RepID=UPI0024A338F1|nr:DUF1206 domain-containing protein [Actinomycetospora sp. NBRC 106378]GLZ54405.1 hypothetical protein Acsp07_40220 [Actinomycetospora sp. NBRC 106378]